MTDQTSFANDDQSNKTNVETTSTFQSDDKQSGEKSVEERLESLNKRLGDQLDFIETLKGENKNLREEASASTKIDELLSKLDASQIESAGQQQTNSPMNMDDLRKLGVVTKQDLEKQQIDSMQVENFNKVSSAMIDTYGEDKYLEVVATKATELGMTLEDIDRLAKSNPGAAIKLMEANKVNNTTNSTKGTINTQAIDNHNNSQLDTTRKDIMFGSTTKEMINEWNRAGEIVKQRNEMK